MRLKKPPPEAWEHIEKLFPSLYESSKMIGERDPRLHHLKELDRYKELGIVKYLFLSLFDENDSLASEAERMVLERLEGINLNELIELDLDARSDYGFGYHFSWGYKPELLAQLKRFSDPIPLLGFASFSHSGYVREEALLQLAPFKTGKELKFFLLRLNDWVREVTSFAKSEVLKRITPEYLPHFVDQLGLIARIYTWVRDDQSEVLQAIEELLADPCSKSELRRALKHPNVYARRLALRIAMEKKALPLLELLPIIASDLDFTLRLFYLRQAKHELKQDERQAVTEALKNDSSMIVRQEVLRISVDNDLKNSAEMLLQALTDKHSSIRELARWYLDKRSWKLSDFQKHYREHLTHPSRKIGAILGIGEVGDKDDVKELLPFLEHKTAKVRRAAKKSIASLDSTFFA